MNRIGPTLDELRRAIDTVDDSLLDLLLRRGELVAAVGRGKSGTGAPIYRPAREAQILRRLLARISDSGEKDRVARVWRTLMAASYERQGGIRLVADPLVEWQALGHFCPKSRPAADEPQAALTRVRAGGADIAVVRTPTPFSTAPWLETLVAARKAGEAFFVLGRIPFFVMAGLDEQEALVIGRGYADPSGEDVTLVAAPVSAPPAGATRVWFGEMAEGLSLFAYGEYVKPDDPRLGAAVWLGAYPRPLEPSGPRAVEFGLRP
jgi:chorismate mutase